MFVVFFFCLVSCSSVMLSPLQAKRRRKSNTLSVKAGHDMTQGIKRKINYVEKNEDRNFP